MPKNVDGTVWWIEQTRRADRQAIQCAFDGIVKAEEMEPSPDDFESYHQVLGSRCNETRSLVRAGLGCCTQTSACDTLNNCPGHLAGIRGISLREGASFPELLA
jgi:hypothetical protein